MPTLEINLHPNQITIYEDPRRFKVIRAGRRFGKSKLAARAIIVKALATPDGMYFVVAPIVAQTGIIWNEILKVLPKSHIRNEYRGERKIILKNGATIWARSGDNPDALRGEGLDGCILDEAAMLRKDVWVEAIRPALADRLGWCWMISTPKGKNWFYNEYLKGMSNDAKYAEYAGFHYTSYDNPFLARSEIDSMAEELPELAYRQEILAEFIEGGGIVFQNFLACVRQNILMPYQKGHLYCMGVDLARHTDFNVFYVADFASHEIVYFERFTQLSWTNVEARIKDVYEQYGNPIVYIDSTGKGEPVYERLLEAGVNAVGINFNTSTKPMLIKALKIAFDREQIFIPDIEIIKNELAAFSFDITPFGNIQYHAPEGMNDDTVTALALVNYGLNGGIASCIGVTGDKDETLNPYEDMEDIITTWDDCVLDLGDTGPYLIPELGQRY